MSLVATGKVWKLPDDVNTDLITPGQYLALPYEEQCEHVLRAIRPQFAHRVQAGDILVGGKNFGCGSSRESAARVLKLKGIGGIVAESFARIFFRNCIAIGLPVLSCPGVSDTFQEGDSAEVDFGSGRVRNLGSGAELTAAPPSPEVIGVIERGGIVPMLREMFADAG